MNGAITLIISCAILFCLAVAMARMAWRKDFAGYINVFAWLMCLSTAGFVAINMGASFSLSVVVAMKLQNALMGCSVLAFAALAIFCALDEPSAKKKKTLARLPLIGALGGWMIPEAYMAGAMVLADVGLLLFFSRGRREKVFLWRTQIKILLPAALLYFYSLPVGALFLAYFLWTLIFRLALVNAAVVKARLLDYDEKLNENKIIEA